MLYNELKKPTNEKKNWKTILFCKTKTNVKRLKHLKL